MKNKALYESSHLLLQYRISSPTLDDIIMIVAQYGYEIIDYDPSSRSTQELIASLSLNHQILSQNAFLYTNHNVKLLFVRDNLDAEDKRVAITHELGHIVCKHADTSIQEEYEANEFVHYFAFCGPRRSLLRYENGRRAVAERSGCGNNGRLISGYDNHCEMLRCSLQQSI